MIWVKKEQISLLDGKADTIMVTTDIRKLIKLFYQSKATDNSETHLGVTYIQANGKIQVQAT